MYNVDIQKRIQYEELTVGSLSAESSVFVPTTGGTAMNTMYGANSEQRRLFKH
jgi:hypothetical protein